MAWSASKITTAYLYNQVTHTSISNWPGDALFEVALWDNSGTPLQTDTAAHQAYAAAGGTWAAGGQSSGTSWPALGRPLVTATLSAATVTPLTFDAVDTASADATCTLSGTYGCCVYDHTAGTPTDQVLCYNYFGGVQTITSGTFTVVWNASGIMAITL